MLGLRFCAWAFSSCGERGPLFIAVRGPLTVAVSLVAEHKIQTRRLTGLVAPRHVGSSQTGARTRVPWVGRQILNHCATREALFFFFFSFQSVIHSHRAKVRIILKGVHSDTSCPSCSPHPYHSLHHTQRSHLY